MELKLIKKEKIKLENKQKLLELIQNKKLRIGIDLDDTIWKFTERFFEYYNNKFNTNFIISQHKKTSFEKCFNISTKEVFSLFDDFSESSYSKDFELIKDSLDSINKLNEIHSIYFITARHEGLFEETILKLQKYFDFKFKLLFVYDSSRKLIKRKVDYCL